MNAQHSDSFSLSLVTLERLFASMPVAMALLDRQGRHVALNQALADFSGRGAHELIGVPVAELDAQSGENIRRDFATFDQGRDVPDHELELNGRTYMVMVRPLRAPDGYAIGLMAAFADITQRKETERQLAEANARLEAYAWLDHLTGISNRRCFDACLEKETSRSLREGWPLALALFDVDNFKHFNDCYGHAAGDECLRAIAASARGALRRPQDELCRYGGEEFAVLLPNTGAAGALRVAENLRQAVQDMNLRHEKNPCGLVTVSLGVSLLDAAEQDPARAAAGLVERADQALYAAKAGGRNCVRWLGPPDSPAPGELLAG